MMSTHRLPRVFRIAVLLCFVTLPVFAADYPTRAITLINPQSPGGLIDQQGRAFAAVAEKYIGQPVVVSNKPGATGMLGALSGAQAAPDGYTLTLCDASLTSTMEWEAANGRTPPFTREDFVSFGTFTLGPPLVIVPYDSPWRSVSDLIRDAKAKTAFYAYCSGGLYGPSHLPVEVFAGLNGLKFRHAPEKGGGPCVAATVGRHVDFAFQFAPTSVPMAQGKKLRILAVVGAKRLKSIPDVPTLKELGINMEYYNWVALLGPRKLPRPIVEKWQGVVNRVMEDPRFIEIIEKQGGEVNHLSGEELSRYWKSEAEMLSKIMAGLAKSTAK